MDTRDFALQMFDYNRFKKDILMRVPAGDPITLYRCGDFVDLCR